jgi:hypothetical protein
MKRLPVWATRAGIMGAGLGLVGASTVLRTPRGEGPDSPQAVVAAAGEAEAVAGAALTGAGLGPEWDLPNLDHPRIDYWVDRFQNVPEMREKFEGFLERGGQWAPLILERLEARGMPLDLLYLAMIESGFNPAATSHASAVGIWQFMRPTGQQYGLPSTGPWTSGATRSARRRRRWTTCSASIVVLTRGTWRRPRTTRARAGSAESCVSSTAGSGPATSRSITGSGAACRPRRETTCRS